MKPLCMVTVFLVPGSWLISLHVACKQQRLVECAGCGGQLKGEAVNTEALQQISRWSGSWSL